MSSSKNYWQTASDGYLNKYPTIDDYDKGGGPGEV